MTLDELRATIAAEEGVGEFAPWIKGGNAEQLRENAVALRHRLDGPDAGHPGPESALAAMFAEREQRNARLLR